MQRADDTFSPPQMMALAYAKGEFRHAWSVLLNLDTRLCSVVVRGTEPVLSQMRLAWWRDQIAKPAAERPKGEPLLAQLSDLEMAQPELTISHYCNLLVDTWELLAAGDDEERPDVFAQVVEHRAQAIFGSYATWCGASPAQIERALEAGRRWSALTLGQTGTSTGSRSDRLGIKPLSLLLMAAQVDARPRAASRLLGAIRLQLHALTGL